MKINVICNKHVKWMNRYLDSHYTPVITNLEMISTLTIAELNIAMYRIKKGSTNCTVYHYTWAFISAWCPFNNFYVWNWNQYFTVCCQTLHHFTNPFMQSAWICSVPFAWFSLQPWSEKTRLWSELATFYAFSFVFFSHPPEQLIRNSTAFAGSD